MKKQSKPNAKADATFSKKNYNLTKKMCPIRQKAQIAKRPVDT